MDDSIIDYDVIYKNLKLCTVLKKYPYEITERFLMDALSWDIKNDLKERFNKNRRSVENIFEKIDINYNKKTNIESDWAYWKIKRSLDTTMLNLYISNERFNKERIAIKNKSIVDEFMEKDIAPIFVTTHLGVYQALPMLLGFLGYELGFFMNENMVDFVEKIKEIVLEDKARNIIPIGIQKEDALKKGLKYFRKNKPFLFFQGFSSGIKSDILINFFNIRVYAPIGVAKFALKFRRPIIPVTFKATEHNKYELNFYEPLFCGNENINIDSIMKKVFEWIEKEVKKSPDIWWCWEILNDLIVD